VAVWLVKKQIFGGLRSDEPRRLSEARDRQVLKVDAQFPRFSVAWAP
jgi:hypothetical protein